MPYSDSPTCLDGSPARLEPDGRYWCEPVGDDPPPHDPPLQIGVQIVHDSVPLPGNPRERGQWTRGGLVLWVPGDTLAVSRWANCSLVSMTRIVAPFGNGFQVALHPHAAGAVKIAFGSEPDHYFSYDPPRPGPVPTG